MDLTRENIKAYLDEINEALKAQNLTGEMTIYGGSVMSLVFNARKFTRDIDAVFEPKNVIRDIAFNMAHKHDLNINWLNDAVKVFITDKGKYQEYMTLSNLRIYTPKTDYLFAMKALAARTEGYDLQDLRVLGEVLKIDSPQKAFDVVEKYYPNNYFPARTQYLLEEMFEGKMQEQENDMKTQSQNQNTSPIQEVSYKGKNAEYEDSPYFTKSPLIDIKEQQPEETAAPVKEKKPLSEYDDIYKILNPDIKEETTLMERQEQQPEETAAPVKEKERFAKRDEFLNSLEEGIKEVMKEENFKKWLDFSSSFHNYSPTNTMLIFIQKEDATMVKGFKSWQAFDRHVVKGEKGIRILAPTIKQMPIATSNADGKPEPKRDENGKIMTKSVIVGFRTVSVFDVSQTEGAPLPELRVTRIDVQDKTQAENLFKAVQSSIKIPVFEVAGLDSRGAYYRNPEHIKIDKSLPLGDKIKTYVHEWAHSQLHSEQQQGQHTSRDIKEIEAESSAYMVCKHFGLDTGDYSFQYLATWSKDIKNLDDVRNVFGKAFDASQKLIETVETQLEIIEKVQVVSIERIL